MKDDKALSPADEADLRYLRNQVDRLSERQYRRDAGPNAHNEYWHAKESVNYAKKERTYDRGANKTRKV